jgi:penicillin-binding protein 1A
MIKKFHFILFILSSIFVILFIISIMITSLTMVTLKKDLAGINLPSNLENFKPSLTTNEFDINGDNIGNIFLENRKLTTYDNIPPLLIDAFISAEDKNFWTEPGFDILSILHDGFIDLISKNKKPLGASTISEQVIKNIVMNKTSFTLKEKIQEAYLSYLLNNKISRKKIIEIYLNDIYLGNNAYGIQSASEIYFQKDLNQLSLSDVAFLATLPKAPSNYDPKNKYENSVGRRTYVLNRMLLNGYISKDQFNNAVNDPLPIPKKNNLSINYSNNIQFYLNNVNQQLFSMYGQDNVLTSGYNVETSSDVVLQKNANDALQFGLETYSQRHGWHGFAGKLENLNDIEKDLSQFPTYQNGELLPSVITDISKNTLNVTEINGNSCNVNLSQNQWLGTNSFENILQKQDVVYIKNTDNNCLLWQIPKVQGAIVVMNAKNGDVLALSGGWSYKDSQYDRSTQSLRQPGSSFKPFIYLTALEDGYTPDSYILDSPIDIQPASNQSMWTPQNDDNISGGLMTITTALAGSRNLAAIRMLFNLGLPAVSKTSQDFGLYDQLSEYPDALGAKEITLLQLTKGYAEIANGGYKLNPIFVKSIKDNLNNVIYTSPENVENNENEISTPLAIKGIQTMLRAVVTNGTASKDLESVPLNIMGKTGTSEKSVDGWFFGFVGNLVIGVHVGFDEPKSLGETEFGATTAIPIFKDFLLKSNDYFKQKYNN